MIPVSVDFETGLIAHGLKAPPATCLAITGSPYGDDGLWHCAIEDEGDLIERMRVGGEKTFPAQRRLEKLLLDPDVLLVGQNIAAFDLLVAISEWPSILPAVFRALAEGRVSDTMIREKMIDIAYGCLNVGRTPKVNPKTGKNAKKSYSLEALCVDRGISAPWKSPWRLRYAELRNVPIEQWPEEARSYPMDDVNKTLELWQAQEVDGEGLIFRDEAAQVRAAFALSLSSAWGVWVDPERMAGLAERARERIAELQPLLEAEGLVRADGKRNIKATRARAEDVTGGDVRLTKKGQTSLAKKAIKGYDDEVLSEYSELAEWRAVVDKDLKMFAPGLVQTSYGLAETGRTTSSGPNIQNLRRLPGVRECFAARPGKVFLVADLSIGELRTWAQVCLWILGYSDMAAAILAGKDPHGLLGADLWGVDEGTFFSKYAEGDDDAVRFRQLGKHTNFGLPGGMGNKTFVELCWTFGHVITEEEAGFFKAAWKKRWSEAGPYFDAIAKQEGSDGTATVEQFVSKRLRGGCYFTDRCNGYFQALLADLAKDVCWRLAVAANVGDGALRASDAHLVIFNHDEWVIEIDPEFGTECAAELEEIVAAAGKVWTPDVPPKVEPLLAKRWSKKAERIVGEDGRLAVWDEDG